MSAAERISADLTGDVAFRLMSVSFVRLFWCTELLDQTVDWLVEHGYQVERLDASGWIRQADFHRDIARTLGFPDYYGRNLDAFNDSFGEGIAGDTAGFVLVFTGYDAFATHDPRSAHSILDIIADHARTETLVGRRMLCLVQSNDPTVDFAPVGARPVMWNSDEWSCFHRGMT